MKKLKEFIKSKLSIKKEVEKLHVDQIVEEGKTVALEKWKRYSEFTCGLIDITASIEEVETIFEMMKSLKGNIFEDPEREQVYLAGHCFEMLKSHPIYTSETEIPTSLTMPFSSPSQNQLELTSWGMRYLQEIRNKQVNRS